MKYFVPALLLIPMLLSTACQHTGSSQTASANLNDLRPINGDAHYVHGYAPRSENKDIQVIVEIPTGTTAKWEVEKSDGALHWEIKNGKPRVVDYVGYPGNYGMIPQTLLPKDQGGDGDPLDVLVLGPPMERGQVIEAKLIGVLKLLDGGEQDDKLIAVHPGTGFYDVDTVDELDQKYYGITTIIKTWFENYKGPGELKANGFGNEGEADLILDKAIAAYKTSL